MGSNMASTCSTEEDKLQDMGSTGTCSTEQDTLQDMGSNMASTCSTEQDTTTCTAHVTTNVL
jgi:hypothetical protein